MHTLHVIGNVGAATPYSHSAMPSLTASLVRELGLNMEDVHQKYKEVDPALSYDLFTRYKDVRINEKIVFEAVFAASVEMTGPAQNVEFLAKPLLHGLPKDIRYPPNVTNILLGSPLYVALAE